VTAVDASRESLYVLNSTEPGVRTVCSDMNSFAASAADRFERIVASYSLYYTDDAPGLFRNLAILLEPAGGLFFCGPSHSNNTELRRLVAGVTGNQSLLAPTRASTFMEEIGPVLAAKNFAAVDKFTFENDIVYSSVEDLFAYWSSHFLYDPKHADAFRRTAEALPMPFINRKCGIGIRAHL
jgi:SAM-dependent methyltransferase